MLFHSVRFVLSKCQNKGNMLQKVYIFNILYIYIQYMRTIYTRKYMLLYSFCEHSMLLRNH